MTNNYQVTGTTQTTPSQVDNKSNQKADGKSVVDLTIKNYYLSSQKNYDEAAKLMNE